MNNIDFENQLVGTSFNMSRPLNLQAIQEAGFSCIELTWQSLDLFDPEVRARCEQVVAEAKKLGIQISSVHLPFGNKWDPSQVSGQTRKDLINTIDQFGKIASEWGAKIAIIHPSFEPIPPDEREQRIQIARETLGEASEVLSKHQIRLAVECLPRTCLGNTGDDIDYLLSGHPDLGICCDVNHLFQELPGDFIRRFGSKIIATHISDHDGIDEKHWLPGEGVNDWKDIMSALKEIKYSEVFMYEVKNPVPDTLKKNWDELKKIKA